MLEASRLAAACKRVPRVARGMLPRRGLSSKEHHPIQEMMLALMVMLAEFAL